MTRDLLICGRSSAALVWAETGAARAKKGLVVRKPASIRARVSWKCMFGREWDKVCMYVDRMTDGDDSKLGRRRTWAVIDVFVFAD